MSNPITLLTAVNVATTSTSYEVEVGPRVTFATFRSGAGTAGVNYEGSLDNVNWFVLGATAPDMQVHAVPVKYIRASYAGSAGPGVVTVQAIQAEED